MTATLTRWTDVDELHRRLAELDAPDPAPHLAAFAGDRLLVVIRLRPFAPGAYRGPLVEALALALPLGADRVSLALPGRAWSLDDPVPPVTDGTDLRQRVLTQVSVDGHGPGRPGVRMALHPFDADTAAGSLDWAAAIDPGPGEGWITDALATLVAAREDVATGGSADERRCQVTRLEALGHLVVLTAAGQRQMAGQGR